MLLWPRTSRISLSPSARLSASRTGLGIAIWPSEDTSNLHHTVILRVVRKGMPRSDPFAFEQLFLVAGQNTAAFEDTNDLVSCKPSGVY